MDIGLLTSPFRTEPIEQVAEFAKDAGFSALEVNARPGSAQLDPLQFSSEQADRIRGVLDRTALRISSLACYVNILEPDPGELEVVHTVLRKTIDAAAALDVEVVCTLAGMPLPGKTKMQTIEQDLPDILGPVLDYAGEKGIRIALENWFATNIQHLEHWRRLFELLPAENFGLNFDPSHLLWQQIDYLAAVDEFGPRIFHTHAKDCEVRTHVLQQVGVLERGWWRYVIPGFGSVEWGAFIGALHRVGYEGVLSIEHEDGAVGREEGFRLGLNFLDRFVRGNR